AVARGLGARPRHELLAEVRAEALLRVRPERPELQHREHAPAAPDAFAAIEDGAAAREPDRSRDRQEERRGEHEEDAGEAGVEPTEAGLRLYRGAQRLLALEEQVLEEVGRDDGGVLTGRLDLGASSGPAGTVLPLLLCEFQRRNPEVRVALSVSDTQRVIEQVARRELEL